MPHNTNDALIRTGLDSLETFNQNTADIATGMNALVNRLIAKTANEQELMKTVTTSMAAITESLQESHEEFMDTLQTKIVDKLDQQRTAPDIVVEKLKY